MRRIVAISYCPLIDENPQAPIVTKLPRAALKPALDADHINQKRQNSGLFCLPCEPERPCFFHRSQTGGEPFVPE